VLAALQAVEQEGVTMLAKEDGTVEIAVTGRVDGGLEKAIAAAIPQAEREGFTRAAAEHRLRLRDQASPAAAGEPFEVPRLLAEIQGSLEWADTDTFMEFHDWSLLDHPPQLDENEFAVRETARSFEIDLDGKSLKPMFVGEEEQLALDVAVEGWTSEALVHWLDRQVRQPDIGQSAMLRWLRDLVGHLEGRRGIRTEALMRWKFILARKVREKIDAFRRQERERVYQRHLFAPDARPEVSFATAFVFKEGMYWDQRRYHGRWKPRRHFLGSDQVPAFDGADGGEERQCAEALDSLPGLRFWIRNVARHPGSFWLPTATDRFYPDFVARLEDDRLLVVEYKGALTADSADTAEKRTIGALWERASQGRGLFTLVEKLVAGKPMRTQMLEKIGRA
jgi:type III restriction enzyme